MDGPRLWLRFLGWSVAYGLPIGFTTALLTSWPSGISRPETQLQATAIAAGGFLLATYLASAKMREQCKRLYEDEQMMRQHYEAEAKLWKQSLQEQRQGFPSLMEAIATYDQRKDEQLVYALKTKRRPAVKAAAVVAEYAQAKRMAEKRERLSRSIIEYYEYVAPFLVDLREEVGSASDSATSADYDEEERVDPVTSFVAKEEYRRLSPVERNQLALDRFWKRPDKPRWLIGRMYERYIGYLYERQGYVVVYRGIVHGYEDLGRDLECRRGNECILIQCKHWSQFKTIFEKHIFQFFGTTFQFRDTNRTLETKGHFYTTTKLSDLSRRFAQELGIALHENFPLDQTYPCIKCNISKADSQKIYHLPFDQQYDKVRIEPARGEFYCQTVAEAERQGFRRAFRYRGPAA
jgi:hypothetical protein